MTISEILQRDHARLEDQAKHLRDANRSDPRRDFVTFNEAMSRHMFLEEHAFLAFLNAENRCNYVDMPELLRQHDALRLQMARIEEALPVSTEPMPHGLIVKLLTEMDAHLLFEDTLLYRLFDTELTEDQQQRLRGWLKVLGETLPDQA